MEMKKNEKNENNNENKNENKNEKMFSLASVYSSKLGQFLAKRSGKKHLRSFKQKKKMTGKMHYTTYRKPKISLSIQSFSGCARDVEEENGILSEVVGKVLELLAHSAHDLFKLSCVIQFLLLEHHLLPIGAFDGESHNPSHSSQGFFYCPGLS